MKSKTRFILYGSSAVLLLIMMVLASTAVFAVPVVREVPCTVTSSTISMTVTGGPVAYGVLTQGETADTIAGYTLTANNTSTESEPVDFEIMCGEAADGSSHTWTLSDSQGTDQFTHEFSISSGSWTYLTDTYQTMAEDINAENGQEFDLRIGMPTDMSYPGDYTITVTIQAVSSS
jgi:hypothetical protein